MGHVVSSIMPSKHQSCLLLMALTITFVDPITANDIEISNVIVDKEAGTLFHHHHQHQFTEITLPLERVSILSNVFVVELVLTYLALVYRYVLTLKREEDNELAQILDLKIWQNGDIRYKEQEDAAKLRRAISDQFWTDSMNDKRLSLCSMGTTNFEEEYGEFDDHSFMTTLPGDDVDCGEMNDLEDRFRDIQRNYVRKERFRAQQLREEQETIDEEEDEVRGQKGQIQNKATKETKKGIYKMRRKAATETLLRNTAKDSLSMDPISKKKLMGNANDQDDRRQKQQKQEQQTQENGNVTKNGSNQSKHEMQSICARTAPRSIGGEQANRERLTFTVAETLQNEKNQNNADHHQSSTEQKEVGTTKQWSNTERSHDDSVRRSITPMNRLKFSIEIPRSDETPSQENDNKRIYESNQSMYPMHSICAPSAPQTVGESVMFTIGETLKNENILNSIIFDDLSQCEDDECHPRCSDAEDDGNLDEDNPFAFDYSAMVQHSLDEQIAADQPEEEEPKPEPVCNRRENEKSGTTNGRGKTVQCQNASVRPLLTPLKFPIDIPMDDEAPSQQQSEVNAHWKQLADPPLGFTTAIIGIDDSEYLRTSYNFATDATTLIRFNVKRNEWKSHIVVPHLDLHTVYGFDTHSKVVYAENQNGNIVGVESESGKWEISKFGNIRALEMRFGFMINGNLHLLHSLVSNVDHIIIDQNGDQTTKQIGDEWNVMSICNAVHSEPRQSIIIFGLSYERIPLFGEYSVTTNHWNTWTWPTADSLDIAHCERAGMLCTADGRYLMFFGGVGDTTANEQRTQSDRITVCDLEDHTAKPFVSAMRCPQRQTFTAFLMEGSGSWEYLAVSGYLRKCYDDLELEKTKTLPHVLVELIMQRISRGYIHLVEKSIGEGHWRISANDVLYSDDSCSRIN